MLRRTFLAASLLAAATALQAPTAAAQQLRDIKFTLSWLPQSVDAPFYIARERGWFEKAGLRVTIDRGFGSADAVVKIGTGQYEIGEGDVYSMIEYNSKQKPEDQLVAVAFKYQRSPLAIITLKEKGIDSPQKLAGRNIGDVAGSATKRLFPVYAKRVGLDESKIQWTNVEARLREQLLVRGQYDAAGVFTLSGLPPLRKMGYDLDKLNIFYYTDAGLELYGNGLITSRKFARDNPEIVRAFVKAYVDGVKETLANPEAALETVTRAMKGDVGWDPDLERFRLKLTMDRLYTDPKERQSVGIGGADMKRLEAGIKQVAEGFGITAIPPAADVFDGRFLAPVAERR
jgi:NitT/TauT family transport system substrate-binding protein